MKTHQAAEPSERDRSGLEGLLQEVFPIESYDGNMKLEYLHYELGAPRYTTEQIYQECIEYLLESGQLSI